MLNPILWTTLGFTSGAIVGVILWEMIRRVDERRHPPPISLDGISDRLKELEFNAEVREQEQLRAIEEQAREIEGWRTRYEALKKEALSNGEGWKLGDGEEDPSS